MTFRAWAAAAVLAPLVTAGCLGDNAPPALPASEDPCADDRRHVDPRSFAAEDGVAIHDLDVVRLTAPDPGWGRLRVVACDAARVELILTHSFSAVAPPPNEAVSGIDRFTVAYLFPEAGRAAATGTASAELWRPWNDAGSPGPIQPVSGRFLDLAEGETALLVLATNVDAPGVATEVALVVGETTFEHGFPQAAENTWRLAPHPGLRLGSPEERVEYPLVGGAVPMQRARIWEDDARGAGPAVFAYRSWLVDTTEAGPLGPYRDEIVHTVTVDGREQALLSVEAGLALGPLDESRDVRGLSMATDDHAWFKRTLMEPTTIPGGFDAGVRLLVIPLGALA